MCRFLPTYTIGSTSLIELVCSVAYPEQVTTAPIPTHHTAAIVLLRIDFGAIRNYWRERSSGPT